MASISISESKPTFFSKGRYVNIQEITKIDDWDSIFKHVIGVPLAVYDTAQLIYDKEFFGASLALGSERTTRLLTLLKDAPQGKACSFSKNQRFFRESSFFTRFFQNQIGFSSSTILNLAKQN